jgi:quercetin dioxygenase-like cupin family protein
MTHANTTNNVLCGQAGSFLVPILRAKESAMSRFVHSDIASAIDIQTGAVVSRVIFSDKRIEVTVFGFDAGAGLSEHQASRAAIVQVTKGRLEFTADGEQLDAGPGFWLHMEPGTPHSLTAREPTVMLLTLVDAG